MYYQIFCYECTPVGTLCYYLQIENYQIDKYALKIK